MLHPSVFPFLEELRDNNNRDWFKDNKHKHDAARACVVQFTQELFERLSDENQLDGQKVFRVYRDVRFSKNKPPYKTHFGISFHRKKPQLRGGYYIHLAPGDSFLATGFWDPSPADLLRIRKELEVDAQEFRDLMAVPAFTKVWGSLEGDAVKTAPKGFAKDHANIDLIRHKQFLFIKKFDDKSVLSPDFQKEVIAAFTAVRPFFDYMSNVLTTDLNGESLL